MNDSATVTRLLTCKSALDRSRIDTAPQSPVSDGQVLLKIDRIALTTNNITYAAFGDAMQYWDFFPTQDPEWGHMPAWGFADVVASTVPGIGAGERFYGYFPIASHIMMQPVRVSPRGFYDGAEHRATLTSAYNHYTRCSNDAAYVRADENYQMIVRPLFITSFMCADFLQDNGFFGATQIIVSSASSKTAYGTAFCLQGQNDVGIIGLTSGRNRDFVESLGCFDATVTYDRLTSMAPDRPTLYLDFSGDETLRAEVHHHFGPALTYDCFAGSARNTEFLRKQDLPGPDPKAYFAPFQIKKRNADWGHEVVNQRFNAAQTRFIRRLSDREHQWMHVAEARGFAAAQRLIGELHAGRTDPRDGHVVILA